VNPPSLTEADQRRHDEAASAGSSPSRSSATARHVAWVATIAYWAALIFVTHIPPDHLPNTHVSDKLEHFAFYGVLTALLLFALSRGGGGLTLARAAGAVAIVLVSGAFDEWTQPWFGRTCSLGDWLADATGAAVAAAAILMWWLSSHRSARVGNP